jgi:hypothetical protein
MAILSENSLVNLLIFAKRSKRCCLFTQPRLLEISMKKLEGKGEASFDTPFMIQSHAESMKEIVGAL